jgi:RNA polymerase sigma-54 factor
MLQVQDQSLRPVATAHLAQTMSLLALPNVELREKVMEELANNPALEWVDERVCPTCHRRLPGGGPCPRCSLPTSPDGPVVFISPREAVRRAGSQPLPDDLEGQEPVAPENLAVHVLQQLAAELDPADRPLAAYILSSLDEDGFLTDPPAFIARATRATLTQVERVISLISHADPPGLATAGPRGALLAQLDLLPQEDPRVALARRLLLEAFSELAQRDFDLIAQRLDTSVGSIRRATAFIQDNLTPYPARAFWGSGRGPKMGDPDVYHTPDIQISQRSPEPGDPLIVEIFSAFAGLLRVNPEFRAALSDSTEEHNEAWSKHLERAALFVKCLQQRNNTMRRLMQILADHQRDFILNGDRHLTPMTRARLAEEIGVHESTVSRAVANKGVALPDGRIIPLARFFDRSLSVRDRIKEIVRQERRPLTDEQIASILERQGVNIARRTVAKYRAIEGILPARLRKARGAAA